MADLIERLLNAEPGARQEAAAEIRRLTASLAAMERERDAWKNLGLYFRMKYATQADGDIVRRVNNLLASAATDALMKQSPESAPKEPPHA